ncbi:DUF1003 domain-containing protein [Rhizobium glycinendophyticum]|uniref:DUF1003 domain-containing protein n=1 Tax=Rhizobium glycinendophyticum TaxID=2589807 RepID=A0A504UGD2_9HYPH|nr:DUF1003 domain-containing protein [Rhizobium glycinendophyticum]TPP05911.1 DUF1003 domain-containing protein [Rhizobium glycinendophyticum]
MTREGRSATHDGPSEVSSVIDQNMEALIQRQRENEKDRSFQEKVAGGITRFAGSMVFVYLHLAFFGTWITVNLGLVPIMSPFDPTLVILAMVASVEAIFISTFVLISQNRMAAESEKRAELALQISLLNEHETTRIITMLSAIAEKLNVGTEVHPEELAELKQDVSPEVVLAEIERRKPD